MQSLSVVDLCACMSVCLIVCTACVSTWVNGFRTKECVGVFNSVYNMFSGVCQCVWHWCMSVCDTGVCQCLTGCTVCFRTWVNIFRTKNCVTVSHSVHVFHDVWQCVLYVLECVCQCLTECIVCFRTWASGFGTRKKWRLLTWFCASRRNWWVMLQVF